MSSVLQGLDGVGAGLLPWILTMTAWTGLLLAAAWLVERVLARRVAARWRVLLFSVVFARLVLPLGWTSPASLIGRGAAMPLTAATSTVGVAARESVRMHGEPTPRRASHAWLAASYLLGVLGVLTLGLACRRRLAREIAFAVPARPDLAAVVPSCTVLEHPSLGPLVVGTVQSRILLPSPLIDKLEARELADILRHEAAHVRRRDPLLAAFLQAACAVAWPVLPAWLAARRIRALMEESCDDVALERASRDERRAYGRTLMRVADWHPRRVGLALSAGLLGFGSALRGRVSALRFMTRWPGVAQAGSVAAAGAVLLVTLGASAPERVVSGPVPAPAADGIVGTPIIRLPDPTLDATGFPTLSPFQAIRWREATPEVSVDGAWHELSRIDGIDVHEIIAFSNETYGINGRKRFEEDLVAVMTRMGHPPGDVVSLGMRSLDGIPVNVTGVPMTRENRQAVKWGTRDASVGAASLVHPVRDPTALAPGSPSAWLLPDTCQAERVFGGLDHWKATGMCDDEEAPKSILLGLKAFSELQFVAFNLVKGEKAGAVEWLVEIRRRPGGPVPLGIDASGRVVTLGPDPQDQTGETTFLFTRDSAAYAKVE